MTAAKFPLGRVVATPGALAALETAGQDAAEFLDRHCAGDWGDLDPEDRAANDRALDPKNPTRILSTYHTSAGERLWIITARDRSVTRLLLPEDR
jgi:hypothetical protein